MARDIRELEKWTEEHPVLAYVNTFGLAILVGELTVLVHVLLTWVVQ